MTARKIAIRAKKILGRPAIKTQCLDYAAAKAVEQAAAEAGYTHALARWAQAGVSLTTLAAGFLGRYGQAYGLAVMPSTPETVAGALQSY